MNNFLAYSLIMFIAGPVIPVMATLNGGLGSKLEGPALAAKNFSVGLVVALAWKIQQVMKLSKQPSEMMALWKPNQIMVT